jgi:hypothetical protein
VRERIQALVAAPKTHGILVRGHAGLEQFTFSQIGGQMDGQMKRVVCERSRDLSRTTNSEGGLLL